MRNLLLTLLICLFSFGIKAGGFQVLLQGTRQIAMGNTGTALPDGASLFFNPGASAMLQNNQVMAGVSGVSAKIAYRGNDLSSSQTISPLGTPFFFYGTFGIKTSKEDEVKRLKLGLGVFTPFGSTVQWPDGWTGQFSLKSLSLQTIYIQPTVAFQLTEDLGIGVGFDYVLGNVNLQRSLPIAVDPSQPYGSVALDGKATGMGFNAGIYYKPIEFLSIGLSYRSGIKMKVKEGDVTFDLTNVPQVAQPQFPSGTKFNAMLPMPTVVTLGFGIHPMEKLVLAVDISMVQWSAYDSLKFEYSQAIAGSSVTSSPRKYKDSFTFRLGGEYRVIDPLKLRAGVYYDMSPVQSGYLTPETPDANSIGASVGLGYTINRLTIDAAFLFVDKAKRTDTGEFSNGVDGTYKTRAYVPSLGISYSF